MKRRFHLRYSRAGWSRLYPSARGGIWVGPFPTADDAVYLAGLAVAL